MDIYNNFRGIEVRKLIRITGLLIIGMLATANVSAYYYDGTDVRYGTSITPGGTAPGDYLGNIGNVHDGLPEAVRGVSNPNWIGSDYIYTNVFNYGPTNPLSYTPNPVAGFESDGTTSVHWFLFSSDHIGLLNAFYEWGADIASFSIDFYQNDGSDTSIFSKTITSAEFAAGHLYHDDFASFPAGEVLMRITGNASGDNSGYKVQLYPSAVPLPPAAMLFVSALAGFGVIGRKKGRKALS